jgi:DNA-binding CsgD family transcriptional regulator
MQSPFRSVSDTSNTTTLSAAAGPAAPAAASWMSVSPPRSTRLAALGHALMQHIETPLIVTDAMGAVLECNPAATRRVERCEGLWLDAAGRLAVRQGGRWVPITKWHAELVAGRGVTLLLEAEGPAMQLTLKPMAVNDCQLGTATWVLASVERVVLTRADAMRRRFRFTRTQARLAEMLCQGMRPANAAEMLGVKISTVRTHVGEMYEKTGTHSQAQLVALLHASQ